MQNSITWWKLNTLTQNIVFLLVVLAAIFVFAKISKKINKKRNDENAFLKAKKELKKLSKNPFYIVENFSMANIDIQGVLIDSYGIVILRAIGQGTEVRGTYSDSQWQILDYKAHRKIDNPLLKMRALSEKMEKFLIKKKFEKTPIDNLVIFTDNHRKPNINLGSGEKTIIFEDLKKWYHSRESNKKMENSPEKIYEILNQGKK